MKRTRLSNQPILAALSLTLALTACLAGSQAFAQETKPTGLTPLSAERTILVTVTAKVEAIDQAKRAVRLKGPLGNSGTIRAEKVENLKQLRLGDTVIVTYTEALAISLQQAPVAAKKN